MRSPGPWVAVALTVLALLYGSAAVAPLLASDRPYVIEAVDHGAYRRARTELQRPVRSLVALLEAGEQGFLAGLRPTSRIRTFDGALEAERNALRLRTATMRRHLPSGGATLLDGLERQVDRAVALGRTGDREPAVAAAHEALATARLAEEGLVARRGERPHPRSVELRPVRSWPLFGALGGLDVLGLALYLLALGWTLARRRLARPGRAALACLGLACAAGAGWELFGLPEHFRGGAEEGLYWKRALTDGELEVVSAVLPPCFTSYDETSLPEAWRPPTWTAAARIEPEPASAERPLARAPGGRRGEVAVEHGEPDVNDPWRHPLGTDGLGRDLLVRLLWGGRISLTVGLVSAALLLAIGVAIGALAGYHGGRVDLVLSRLIEVVQCFPTFFLIVTAVALIPERRLHPLFAVVIVIALVGWTGVARLVRAEFLRARELDYVAAARSLGFSSTRIAFGHVLPNVLGPVLVAAAFAVASGMLIESGVSFLGFGVRHPVPSWGALLSESRSLEHWWLQLFPGLLIFAAVLATHVLGEALRERLDPRGAGGTGDPGDLGGPAGRVRRAADDGGAAPEPLGGRALAR